MKLCASISEYYQLQKSRLEITKAWVGGKKNKAKNHGAKPILQLSESLFIVAT